MSLLVDYCCSCLGLGNVRNVSPNDKTNRPTKSRRKIRLVSLSDSEMADEMFNGEVDEDGEQTATSSTTKRRKRKKRKSRKGGVGRSPSSGRHRSSKRLVNPYRHPITLQKVRAKGTKARYSHWIPNQNQVWNFACRLSSIANEDLINFVHLPLSVRMGTTPGSFIKEDIPSSPDYPCSEGSTPSSPDDGTSKKNTTSNNSEYVQINTPTEFFHTMGFRSVKALGRGGYGLVLLVEKTVPSVNDNIYGIKSGNNNDPDKSYSKSQPDQQPPPPQDELISFTKQQMACKIIVLLDDNSQHCTNQFQSLRAELYILQGLRGKCPHLVEYYEHYVVRYFSTVNNSHVLMAHIFMEFADSGCLVSEVESVGPFSINLCRRYFAEMVDGLAFIHRHQIAHNDLKLDNVLLCSDPANPKVKHCKLTDFGLARFAWKEGVGVLYSSKFMGTRHYMAPEVMRCSLSGKYQLKKKDRKRDEEYNDNNEDTVKTNKKPYVPFKADVWSMGVCLYVMLTKQFPYDIPKDTKKFHRLVELLEKGAVFKGDAFIGRFSSRLSNLLKGMMEADPEKRLTIGAIAGHSWLTEV